MAFQVKVTGYRDLSNALKAATGVVTGWEMADALEDGAWVVAFEAKQNALRQGLYDTGELVDKIKPRKVNQYRVDVMAGAVHSAVHEYGYTGIITDRQRRFFWAKWAETKDTMWKALALSVTYTIPARPYLRPAVDTKKGEAMEVAARSLGDKIRRAVA